MCHVCGGGGTEEERVRMPAGPWKVSDLDIIVDPLVPSSEPREGPEAPTDSDCTSSEFFRHDIKKKFLWTGLDLYLQNRHFLGFALTRYLKTV